MPPHNRRRRRNATHDNDCVPPPPLRRRKSSRISSMDNLAKNIVENQKVVFITGAGISVASGVRPFRGTSGVWTQFIWSTATREALRKDPLKWYNSFWLDCMPLPKDVHPNQAHGALAELLALYPNMKCITQNVDGLHDISTDCSQQIIEAHGRVGLYKCLPAEDSDTDSDDDDDDDRLVHLGHRRKRRIAMKNSSICQYQQFASLNVDQVEPKNVRQVLQSGSGQLEEAPRCPSCRNVLAPQALLFDEGYHSHDYYQFQKMEE